jgi:chromosomal replication initiator protein
LLDVREADRTLDEVVEAVANRYGLSAAAVVSGSGRVGHRARRIAKHLALRVTHKSLSQIGSHFGGVDPNNVLHAFRTVERDVQNDAQFAAEVAGLKASLIDKTGKC